MRVFLLANDITKWSASFLDPIWAEHHVGPARVSGDIYLDACPPPFQTEDIASIPGVRSIRPVAFDGPPVVAPPIHSWHLGSGNRRGGEPGWNKSLRVG